jgi:hypothetical protein
MSTAFQPGEPVVDMFDHQDVGKVDDVRADGWLRVIWTSGRHEWVHASTMMWAPGYKRQKRPTG